MISSKSLTTLLFVMILSAGLFAKPNTDTFSQWRGLNRDGVYHEQDLLKNWPKDGPELLWKAGLLGKGFASAAVTADAVYTTGMIDGKGYVFAIDKKGTLKWKTEYGAEWTKSYEGARTTPTVLDDLLYVESTSGDVVCLNTSTGEIVWKTSLMDKYAAKNITWGLTESLLIDGDRLICTPGGSKYSLIALDRYTGDLIWTSAGNGDDAGYCSPTLIEHGGTRLIITMTGKSILGVNADNGKLLWSHPHSTKYNINPNTPYYKDGKIYCVSGYGTGGVQLELSLDGRDVKEVWRNKSLDSQMDAFVVIDGFIYGTSHQKPGWHCLDWKTGLETYKAPGLGKGNVIFSDGLIYFYGDTGKLGLIKPNSQKFDLISSFKVTHGAEQHWAHPVISDGILYVRHGDVLMAYNIKS